MAVRQDWTRFTRIIHDILVSPGLSTRVNIQARDVAPSAVFKFAPGNMAVARDRKLLDEIERRKGRVLVNNVRNQLR